MQSSPPGNDADKKVGSDDQMHADAKPSALNRFRRRRQEKADDSMPADIESGIAAVNNGVSAQNEQNSNGERIIQDNLPQLDPYRVVDSSLLAGPMTVLEPHRTDPVNALQGRRKRIERLAALAMPEVHFIGQIISGHGLFVDSSEGAFCRWKIDHGKAWEYLSGELQGQTQVAFCRSSASEYVPFNHPIDVHFAEAGLQGWGAPRISMQAYRMDCYGRRILVGYGFAHLPVLPGVHKVEVSLWRPSGSPEQELDAALLGRTPCLVSHAPIYDSAWNDRCRLVTVPAGKVFLDIFVVTRFLKQQGVDLPYVKA